MPRIPRPHVLTALAGYSILAIAAAVVLLARHVEGDRYGVRQDVQLAPPAEDPAPVSATRSEPNGAMTPVEAEIARVAGRPDAVSCAGSGFLWSCSILDPGGMRVRSARFELSGDGSYRGVFVGFDGIERRLAGCCVQM